MWSKNSSEIIPVWVTVNTNADYWSILYGPGWSRVSLGMKPLSWSTGNRLQAMINITQGKTYLPARVSDRTGSGTGRKLKLIFLEKIYHYTSISFILFQTQTSVAGIVLIWYLLKTMKKIFWYTEMEKLSFWGNFHQWLMLPVTFFSKWQYFHISVMDGNVSEVPVLTVIYWVSNISVKSDHIHILSLWYEVLVFFILGHIIICHMCCTYMEIEFNHMKEQSTVAWWHHMTTQIWVNIDSGNASVPDGTKLLPEPLLTYQWGPVTFIWGQFLKRYLSLNSL